MWPPFAQFELFFDPSGWFLGDGVEVAPLRLPPDSFVVRGGVFSDGLVHLSVIVPGYWSADDLLDYLAPCGCLSVTLSDWRLHFNLPSSRR